MDDGTQELARQRQENRELRAQVAGLAERLAALEAQIGESGRRPVSDGDDRTDRRGMLRKAATMTAGAVVGGAALALGEAAPAAAAQGVFTGNPAVEATAVPSSGAAVRAISSSGPGLYATSSSFYGAVIESTTSIGMAANGDIAGVQATSVEGTSLRLASDHNHVWFLGSAPAPPATTGSRTEGQMVCDVNGDLWMCIASGTPGTWRKVVGPSTSGALHALATPKRVYDSRPGTTPATGPKAPLEANTARTVDLKGSASGVPAGATAVLLNLVATGTTTGIGGFLTVFRNGIAFPGTSNVNWSGAGQTVAVTTLTAVDGQARCALYAGSATDVVVDVLGYYR